MKKDLTSQNKEGVSAFPFPTSADHGARASVEHSPTTEVPSEDALDHGIEESFPASDPVSVSVTKLIPIASGGQGAVGQLGCRRGGSWCIGPPSVSSPR